MTTTDQATEQAAFAPDMPPPAAASRRAFPWRAIGLRLFIILLIGALVVLVATQWGWWVSAVVVQTTDDAYLTADTTPLAAKVAGYVRRVLVDDFQQVKAGQLLVEIEDDDYRARLAQAQANVQAADAAIATLQQQKQLQSAMIRQANASVAAAEADLTRYHLEKVRQENLLLSGIAGTRQITEQAVDNEKRAEATLAVDFARLDQQRDQLNVLDSQEKQARAALAAQTALRDLAAINLGYTHIVAPADGMVGQRQVQVGQYLSIGTQVVTLVPLPHIWVIANYKETQMTRVRIGQAARVTVDSFPGVVLHGHVDSWSPASGAQFALLPPDNATGNFTKVVQRIPVKIVLDPNPAVDGLLRAGMSVIAAIDTK